MPTDTTPDSPHAARTYSTEPEQVGRGWTRFEQSLRIFAYVVIFGVVIGALIGLTGLRTRSVTGSNDGLRVTVTYAQVTRPGISTPFEIDIESTTGASLPDELTIQVSSDYLAMFDENGLDPEPDHTASDGSLETWTYQLDGDTRLHIDFDARLQPNIHSGDTGTVRVDAADAAPVTVHFRTWVLP